ncbi:MAG TPA: sensor histidine kinase [Candidatus Sulfotelmatobacter sp.]|nr:sensor histidine kinase [Candidatus Sulfotelmatobacter sp.]
MRKFWASPNGRSGCGVGPPGLGLSICKRITEAHGGTIQVENNSGRGASFTVTLRVT